MNALKTLCFVLCLLLSAVRSWAATPVFVFDDSANGSDTAASGAGPATALSGTNASFSGSVVTLDGSPNLSGFNANTWILWLKTDSGRQYFDLSSADDGADTVTCVNAPAGTATGRTWGIGGKRKTFDHADSRVLFNNSNLKNGWIIETVTNQNVTSSAIGITGVSSGINVIRGSGAIRTISQSANAACLTCNTNGGRVIFENLKFQNTYSGSKTGANGLATGSANTHVYARNCIFGDATNTLRAGVTRGSDTPSWIMTNCVFQNCTVLGMELESAHTLVSVRDCLFKANAQDIVGTHTASVALIENNLFYGATGGDAINLASSAVRFINNTVHGGSADGLELTAEFGHFAIYNNNFTANIGAGLKFSSGSLNTAYIYEDYNNYGTTGGTNNSGGDVSGISKGANSLTVDPGYASAASGNFSVGTNVKAKGLPLGGTTTIGAGLSSTYSYVDIGAAQRSESSFPTSWTYRLTHSVTTEPASNLTDFVYLVSLNAMPAEFWQNVSAGGADIRVTKDAAGSQLIPCDVIEFSDSGSTGTGLLAVKFTGTKSSSTDEPLYIWVGCPLATAPLATDTFGQYATYPSDTWFWPSGGGTDRSSHQLALSATGSPTLGGASGYVNGTKATDFNGSSQYYSGTTPITAAPLTMTAMFNTDTLASNTFPVITGIADNASTNESFDLRVTNTAGTTYVQGVTWHNPSAGTSQKTSISTGTWYRGAAVFASSSSRTVYLDGSAGNNDTTSVTPTGLDDFAIGIWKTNSPSRFWDGKISLVFLYNTAKSADWVAYQNSMLSDADQSDFYGTWTATATSGLSGSSSYSRSRVVNQ